MKNDVPSNHFALKDSFAANNRGGIFPLPGTTGVSDAIFSAIVPNFFDVPPVAGKLAGHGMGRNAPSGLTHTFGK